MNRSACRTVPAHWWGGGSGGVKAARGRAMQEALTFPAPQRLLLRAIGPIWPLFTAARNFRSLIRSVMGFSTFRPKRLAVKRRVLHPVTAQSRQIPVAFASIDARVRTMRDPAPLGWRAGNMRHSLTKTFSDLG